MSEVLHKGLSDITQNKRVLCKFGILMLEHQNIFKEV